MSNRDRVIVWPLDAWRRAVTEKPSDWEHMFFADPQINAGPHPANWEAVGYVQQGHNRGMLVRSKSHGGYAMYDRPFLRALLRRKVLRALADYDRDADAAWAAAMRSLRAYNLALIAGDGNN